MAGRRWLRLPGRRRPTTRGGLAAVSAPFALSGLGVVLTVVGLLALAAGVVWSWVEFSVLGLAALVLVTVALAWVWVPTTPEVRLAVRPHRIEQGGRPATARLEVRGGGLPLLGSGLELQHGGGQVPVALPFLPPFVDRAVDVELPGKPRGVYQVGPVRHVRTDPLRLARRTRELGGQEEVRVRPVTASVPLFAPGLSNDLEGSASSQLSMSDLAFHALREYRPGDDLRHVHWRSSAKSSRLQVRQYHTTRRGHVTVVLDNGEQAYPSPHDFELAVSVATSFAVRAARDDLDVHLRCGEHQASTRVPEHLLDLACAFTTSAHADHRAAVAAARSAAPGTGLLLQVSGSGRDFGELRAAAGRFGGEVSRQYVRADTALGSRSEVVRGERQVTVSDLAALAPLLAGGLR